jgi:hypothetical protein
VVVTAGLAAVPFTFHLELENASRSLLSATVPAADVLLWGILAALAVLAVVARRSVPVQDRRLVSFEMLALILVAGLSVVRSGLDAGSLREWIQWSDSWLLWYALFALAVRGPGLLRWVLLVPVAVVALSAVVAWGQMLTGTPAWLVRSLFRDHQSFVASFVMLAPLAWAGLQFRPGPRWGLVPHLLIGFGTASLGSLAAGILVLAEILVTSRLLGGGAGRRSILAACSIVAFVAVSFPFNGARLLREPGEWFSVSQAGRRLEVLAAKEAQHEGLPEFHFGAFGFHVFMESNFGSFGVRKVGWPAGAPSGGSDRVLPEYFAECWSAIGIISGGHFLGEGPGNWQEVIGTGYGPLERTGTTFPNNSNGFLLLAVSTGILGLVMWLAVARRHLLIGWRKLGAGRAIAPLDRSSAGAALRAGAWTGLLGGTVMTLFCPIPALALSVYWVFLAVLCRHLPERSES